MEKIIFSKTVTPLWERSRQQPQWPLEPGRQFNTLSTGVASTSTWALSFEEMEQNISTSIASRSVWEWIALFFVHFAQMLTSRLGIWSWKSQWAASACAQNEWFANGRKILYHLNILYDQWAGFAAHCVHCLIIKLYGRQQRIANTPRLKCIGRP